MRPPELAAEASDGCVVAVVVVVLEDGGDTEPEFEADVFVSGAVLSVVVDPACDGGELSGVDAEPEFEADPIVSGADPFVVRSPGADGPDVVVEEGTDVELG